MLEIILTILVSIVLVVLIVFIVLFLIRKPSNTNESTLDLKEIGALSKQIELLAKDIKGDVQLTVATEMAKLNGEAVKNSETNNSKLERFQKNISDTLNSRFDAVNKQIADKLQQINQKVDEKLAEGFKGTTESMAQVRERLQAIDAAQKNIENLSKDVVSLKQVLEGNQTRGQYGEYQLSMVLHNVFGDTTGCYEEQYTLKKTKDGNNVRADAVVFMPEPNRLLCIDSKFPFKDYSRVFEVESQEEKDRLTKEFSSSVKKHITDIKDKYIVEGKTAPEALMFIPNDGVFAFIHQYCRDAVDYAREKKVVLTSPSTLPAILVTINSVRIQVERAKNVELINKQLQKLSKDFEMFGREWSKFSDALDKTTRQREQLDHRVDRISNKFDAIKTSDEISNQMDNGEEHVTINELDEIEK